MTTTGRSFNPVVLRLSPDDLALMKKLADDEEQWGKDHPLYGPPTRTREQCSRRTCQAIALFLVRYSYISGRKGRVTYNERRACQAHAFEFANKHGLTIGGSVVITVEAQP